MSDVKKRRLAAAAHDGNADGSADADYAAAVAAAAASARPSSAEPEPACFKVPGLVVTDRCFKVPLDHSGRLPGEISLFVRELVTPVNARRPQPYLLYLQGGPGFESPRPTEASGWIKSAVASFRVVLMDQRGTGRSSPITTANLARRGTPEQQAQYLALFRADSIVRDAELVRKALVPRGNGTGGNDGRWSVLGQSFGGFCALTYLSLAPQGLTEVLMTGGIAPRITAACAAEAVYEALFARVLTQNRRYYARFPGDVALVQRLVLHLAAQPGGGAPLPGGSLLTPRALQLLGLTGLGAGGGFERLHYLLEEAFDGEGELTPSFLKGFDAAMSWGTNPLYALLHEAIYCQGANSASRWAAQRVRDSPRFRGEFDAVAAAEAGRPVFFTGEMVFPWMFDDFAPLRPYKRAAELLAQRADWPALYRPDVLAGNTVPLAAATYLEDMYVDYGLAQESLRHVGGARQWVTNEYKHSGIRDDGGRILDRLLGIARDVVLLE